MYYIKNNKKTDSIKIGNDCNALDTVDVYKMMALGVNT